LQNHDNPARSHPHTQQLHRPSPSHPPPRYQNPFEPMRLSPSIPSVQSTPLHLTGRNTCQLPLPPSSFGVSIPQSVEGTLGYDTGTGCHDTSQNLQGGYTEIVLFQGR
jgi:hypothetical protein